MSRKLNYFKKLLKKFFVVKSAVFAVRITISLRFMENPWWFYDFKAKLRLSVVLVAHPSKNLHGVSMANFSLTSTHRNFVFNSWYRKLWPVWRETYSSSFKKLINSICFSEKAPVDTVLKSFLKFCLNGKKL